ncbi:MAG: hypothetical protein G3M70_11950 [Candidatus Nitronauta litoralis]|uniref:Uncharacterized protein n=1 Tax=Candidatus Nitronauta litoralis TaxID=2705533 RepID=A0A7T0BX52_9BACT|nr:MAG: hypothetical protein G3M70_11950 [Candidatus Nitronauta litoralis]
MSLNLKAMFSGFLKQAKEQYSETGNTEASQSQLNISGDEEVLTEEIPYKLEPSLAEVEQYLGRIRRNGL